MSLREKIMVDYFEDLKKIISAQYGIDEESIEENSKLEQDLNISELDMEDLVANLEQKYQVSIPEGVYSHFNIVGDIAAYLYENVDQA